MRSSHGKQPLRNAYELIGAVRGLGTPDSLRLHLGIRQQILINILLSYVQNPQVTMEVYSIGLTSLSDDLLKTIDKKS